MMGTVSVLVDELDVDEFIVGDLEASDIEQPVAVTDRATAAVKFHTAGTQGGPAGFGWVPEAQDDSPPGSNNG